MRRSRKSTTSIVAVLMIGSGMLSVGSTASARGASGHAPTQDHHPSERRSSTTDSRGYASTSPTEIPRRTADEFAGVPGTPSARFWADSISDFEQALPQGSGPWLILSEGGEDGAYGAGVLSGWTKEGSRPVFSVVTGASTGALIAPYAFLGADYDDRLQQDYTTVTAADIFELRATARACSTIGHSPP